MINLDDPYTEASKALEYKILMGYDSIISYDTVCNRGSKRVFYSFNQERELVNYLRMGAHEEIQITVNNKVLSSVELRLEKNEIPAGQKTNSTITARLNDGSSINLKDTVIVYSSSNEEVATVDENGTVTAIAGGEVDIAASVTLGNTTIEGKAKLYVVPVRLETINAVSNKNRLFVGRKAILTITGKLNNTFDADLSEAEIVYGMYSVIRSGTCRR